MFSHAQTNRWVFSLTVLVQLGGLFVLLANVEDFKRLVVATSTSKLVDNDCTMTSASNTSISNDSGNNTAPMTTTNDPNAFFMTSVEEETERQRMYSQAKSDLRASAKARVAQRGSIYNKSMVIPKALAQGPFPPFSNLPPLDRPQEKDTPLPTFQVVGNPKAGTSQLYRILESHPNVSKYSNGKEFCIVNPSIFAGKSPMDPDAYKDERIIQAIRQEVLGFYKKKQKNIAKSTSVNGCLDPIDFLINFHYFGKESFHSKILYLFRDPADWMWAA